jgi:hypothetical protein
VSSLALPKGKYLSKYTLGVKAVQHPGEGANHTDVLFIHSTAMQMKNICLQIYNYLVCINQC